MCCKANPLQVLVPRILLFRKLSRGMKIKEYVGFVLRKNFANFPVNIEQSFQKIPCQGSCQTYSLNLRGFY